MKVYLDDNRPCPEGWLLAQTADDCIRLLQTRKCTHLSLDHDLSFEQYHGDYSKEKSGYDVLLWLCQTVMNDQAFPVPEITLHTMNPAGRARMKLALHSLEKLKNER
mgnify:CR=1 FL=1